MNLKLSGAVSGFLIAALTAALAHAADITITRLPDNPIIRPEMMPKDDGEWSGNIGFPCLVRVPAWVDKPLGKYYLYFSAHHGTYIRMAYADQVTGPWKIHEPGTLRLEQVEAINGAKKAPGRHVASPDIVVDDEHKELRMYFHFLLPKLGHKGSVAISKDGLHFEPRAGAIGGPYLRVFRRDQAYFAVDDSGEIVRSADGLEPFKGVSKAVKTAALSGLPDKSPIHFRHAGINLDGDALTVFYSRIGDAPEKIMFTRVKLEGEAGSWKGTTPAVVLEPERDYEGIGAPITPSTPVGQTNVRQLRDPFIFREDGHTYLLYAVAGETGIAIAEVRGL